MIWIITLISLICVLFYWDYSLKRHRIKTFKNYAITGPLSLPFLGTSLDAISVTSENILDYTKACHKKFGKTFRLWILNDAQVYTADLRYIQSVLTSNTLLEKGGHYDLLRDWLADGLLLSVGRKWHNRRKTFTPAFHFQMLQQYVRVFNEQGSILVQQFKPHADGQTAFDVFHKISLAALDVISQAAMGVQVQAQLNPHLSYVRALKSFVYIQANRMLNLWQKNDWLFRLSSPNLHREHTKSIRVMHEFTIDVIEKRRAELQNSGIERNSNFEDKPRNRRPMALLDILLQSTIDGEPMSNEDIREEVDTFIFEGDDTTTSALSHAFYCISRHPDVQQKLVAEIEQVLGELNHDRYITMQQMNDLKYLECVIKEVLRLHPPVPAFGRKVTTDFQLDDIVLPAKTSIYLIIYWAHRDPVAFPDPEAFKPERFAKNEESSTLMNDRNPFAYIPFSAGPKNCIGQKFAMLEMKVIITKILQNYELLPLGSPVKPMANFILRSSNGVNIGLRPRLQTN